MFAFLFLKPILSDLEECHDYQNKEISLTIGDKQNTFSAAYLINNCQLTLTGEEYSATGSPQVAFLVANGGYLKLSKAVVKKTGSPSDANDDKYNFYGLNSVIVVVGDGSKAELEEVTIQSEADGANALFATNKGYISAKTITITSTQDSSRGLDSTYDGIIEAVGINIHTQKAHCASLATDRSEGTIIVTGIEENNMNILSTAGEGSPCIYSTGNITVKNVIGTSESSEAIVIEGKNSVTLIGSQISGKKTAGVMLYQSMSGDADEGTSILTLQENSKIEILDETLPLFYITNTKSVININSPVSFKFDSKAFVLCGANRWGNTGKNGGQVTINVNNFAIEGDSFATASDSSITFNLDTASTYTGGIFGSVTFSGEGIASTTETAEISYSTQTSGDQPSGNESGERPPVPPSSGSGESAENAENSTSNGKYFYFSKKKN